MIKILLLALSFSSFAQVFSDKTYKHVVSEEVSLEVRVENKAVHYGFMNGLPLYKAKMVAKIETKKPEDLKKYGIIQFTRGCVYNSKITSDGKIIRTLADADRQYFGNTMHVFKHPVWGVDSPDLDPVYWSTPEGRDARYRLDDPFLETPAPERRYVNTHYKNERIKYVRDLPGGASQQPFEGKDQEYRNVSLEFRTCLVRLADVPEVGTPEDPELEKQTLACQYWSSNYVYDFDKKKFEDKGTIEPFCLEK